MTENKKKKRKRQELSLAQKTYFGIGIFIVFLILLFKVFIPQYALFEGRKIAKAINAVITEDHFELVDAERSGIQFFSRYQSTKYKDLYISTDMAPRDFTTNRISYLYEKARTEKAGTMLRFAMGTEDTLYDALLPLMGDKLLRVVGNFLPGSEAEVQLDEPFSLGKLKTYTPTIDILDNATDENYIKYLKIITDELNTGKYGYVALNVLFTTDRKTGTTYSWTNTSALSMTNPIVEAEAALKKYRAKERVDEFTINDYIYFDYPYNHDFTLPKKAQ